VLGGGDRIGDLAVVEHGAAPRGAAHEADAARLGGGAIVAAARGLVPPEGERRLAPAVGAEQDCVAFTSPRHERFVYRHVHRAVGGGREEHVPRRPPVPAGGGGGGRARGRGRRGAGWGGGGWGGGGGRGADAGGVARGGWGLWWGAGGGRCNRRR